MCWLTSQHAALTGCTGVSNESFFSEMRGAGRAALELAKERADAVSELNVKIKSIRLHLTPRSTVGAQQAAAAWEAAAAAAADQPGMDDKLLVLLLERTNITLVNSSVTFDIYEPFETEADRGSKLAVEELTVDEMRFRNAVTRSDLQLAQSGAAGLSKLEPSVLKKLAYSEGIAQSEIDATDDEQDKKARKAKLVALITAAMAASGSKSGRYEEGVPPDPEPEQEPSLQRPAGSSSSSGGSGRQVAAVVETGGEGGGDGGAHALVRTGSMRRQIAQAQIIRHLPSRDEIEKDGLTALVTEGGPEAYRHVAELAGLRLLMEEEGAGSYCEFIYHMVGSYNEHVVRFESGSSVTYQGWSGACHRGFQAAQMQCVLITGHPQQERCDGEYRWRGRWHDSWPMLERERGIEGSGGREAERCYCYRGMGSRERKVGDAWVISDDDGHLDDEDGTGLGFIMSTAEQPLAGLGQSWRCLAADGRWTDSVLTVTLLPG